MKYECVLEQRNKKLLLKMAKSHESSSKKVKKYRFLGLCDVLRK